MTSITDLIQTIEASKQTGEPIVVDTETFTAICKFMTMLGQSGVPASLAEAVQAAPSTPVPTKLDPQKLITFKEAADMVGVSLATLNRLRKRDDTFPKPLSFTSRSKRLYAGDVALWLSKQQHGSR